MTVGHLSKALSVWKLNELLVDDLALVLAICVCAIMLVCAFISLRRAKFLSQPYREEALQTEVAKLRATVDVLMADRLKDQRRITELEAELRNANIRITELEAVLHTVQPRTTEHRKSLLVIIGPDPALEIDLVALRKVKTQTGLDFSRRLSATRSMLKRDLDAARVAGNPIPYVHISAHMSANGVELADGIVSGAELSEMLQDVQVLVLAGCESTVVGDLLGVVPYVITLKEKVTHMDAMNFTDVFWRKIGSGTAPDDAFYATLDQVPAVSEFAELHSVVR